MLDYVRIINFLLLIIIIKGFHFCIPFDGPSLTLNNHEEDA